MNRSNTFLHQTQLFRLATVLLFCQPYAFGRAADETGVGARFDADANIVYPESQVVVDVTQAPYTPGVTERQTTPKHFNGHCLM